MQSLFTDKLLPVLVGVLFGTALGAWVASRRSKSERAVNLYWDFHSKDMGIARVNSDKLLSRELGDTPKSDFELYQALSIDEWCHISRVLHFFERVEILLDRGLVAKRITLLLFRDYFEYYWTRYLSKMYDRARLEHERGVPEEYWAQLRALRRRYNEFDARKGKRSRLLVKCAALIGIKD